jgi:uncharacterized protein with ParB-like and HNH nuclease domain
MSTLQIVGKEYYLKHIFGDGFRFFIPRYQRPYAWTTEETEELMDDLWTAHTGDALLVTKQDPYFLGSIVLMKEEHQPKAEVIDGQQRLTTLTILMSVLRHLQPNGADAISDYLRQKGKIFEGMKDEFRLTLRPQDAEFFEKYIQKHSGLSDLDNLNPSGLRNDAQRNIRANALYLAGKLKAKQAEQLAAFTQFIITKCLLVVVSTPDMESAYRIFSVMNDRGLNLSHADILKAEVIGKIPGDANQDAYGKKWEIAEENLGREAFDNLFAHIRMIRVKQKLRTTILKEIREHVKPSADPTKFIDDQLTPYADALETIKDADYQSAYGAEKVNAYLKWLNRVDNFDWVPPGLVALAKHENNPEWLGWFFMQLERLAACMMIMRYGINDRLERYANVLQVLEDGGDDVALAAKLEPTDYEKRKTFSSLNGNLYELTKVRAYVLLRLDAMLSAGGALYDYPIVTIEHVLPQTPQKGSKWLEWFPEQADRDEWVHRLGNLVLLSRKKNSEAQNYDFETKKNKYFKSDSGVVPFVLTTEVLGHSEWTPMVLQNRQDALLEKLRNLWALEEWDAEDGEHLEDVSGGIPKPRAEHSIPERYDIRKKFWTGLLEAAKEKTQLHANRSPGQHNWIGAGCGKRGLGLNYAVREHDTQVELYIDRGTGAEAENKAIFDVLFAQKVAIEHTFGDDLEWQRLGDKRACRVRKVIDIGGWRDAEKWPQIHEAAADAMSRLEKALKPAIAELKL